MSSPGSSDPKTAPNPALGSSSRAHPSGGSTHRVPGGFVPPSAEIKRGIPKNQPSGSRGNLVPLAIAGGVLAIVGLAGAWLFSRANTAPSIAAAPADLPGAPGAQVAVVSSPNPGAGAASPGEAQLPSWVPEYLSGARTAGNSHLVAGELQGTIQYKTTNSATDVVKYYEGAVGKKGLVITALTLTDSTAVLEAKSTDGARKLIVMAQPSQEGAQASVVFTTMDPDKSRPTRGGTLPAFLPLFEGGQLLEQTTRSKAGSVFGFIKFKVKTPAGPLLDFYQAHLVAAHYEVERIDRPGFGRLAGTSLKTDPPANVFVEEKEGELEVLLQVLQKE